MASSEASSSSSSALSAAAETSSLREVPLRDILDVVVALRVDEGEDECGSESDRSCVFLEDWRERDDRDCGTDETEAGLLPRVVLVPEDDSWVVTIGVSV
ncbi:hypothetical protein BG000_010445 [Podila horticola]|nr:hypothetical protein BG000_010445 [Podila horticola]